MQIVECLDETERIVDISNEMKRFRAKNFDGVIEEIITYNDLIDRLEESDGENGVWKFTYIESHKCPLKPTNPEYKGSLWDVQV